ncbi:pogo transposable element derived with ZNF domain a isoform X2 [Esox lucius]|uniref:Pogo transposable element derived with ZNF domain a n=1 Tax=Esox lucius TaxID=8010 RepID=A0AAY5KIZ8_ESOLU|nr:pogo transposable element derived with ZNF domain a isoform X2 [Esox lucius]
MIEMVTPPVFKIVSNHSVYIKSGSEVVNFLRFPKRAEKGKTVAVTIVQIIDFDFVFRVVNMVDSDVNMDDIEINASDSELHMECVEEDLTPWQHQSDNEMEETSSVKGPPNHTLVTRPSDVSGVVTKPLRALAPCPPQSLVLTQAMTNVLQPLQHPIPEVLQMPAAMLPSTSSVNGQNIIFTTQNIQGATQTISAKKVGYIVNGQPITVLPGVQGTQLQLMPQQVLSQPLNGPAPSGFTTVRIPVTLTIRTNNGVSTISTVASGGVNLTPTPVAVPTTPSITSITSAGSMAVAGSHVVRVAPLTISPRAPQCLTARQSPSPARAPGTSGSSSGPSPSAPLRVISPASATPKMCKYCRSEYKMVNALRGFMCLCSKEIAQSLDAINSPKSFRPGKLPKSSKPKAKSSKAAAYTPSSSSSLPTFPRTAKEPAYSSEGGSPPPEADQQGKLIMLVEDFYYGVDKGRSLVGAPVEKSPGVFKCIHCSKTLKNNIKLMNHMRHHVEVTALQNGGEDTHTTCQHCFRNFTSPFSLQCHVEGVHSQFESTAKCKICELVYDGEPLFLQHMKNTHKPGEMPYICQVCDYRSSQYTDVYTHFREVHCDTVNLLCPYCLKVFRSSSTYQSHYSRHQKKTVFQCDMCRLQFLFAKDRAEHKVQYHKTHVKPRQLEGLKPGTRVTIRAYAVQGKEFFHSESVRRADLRPSRVIDVPSSPQKPVPKKKPVESLMELLTKFQRMNPLRDRQNCMECTFEIPDFANHFPTCVHCSLCRYSTCCSRAYANHMINNHVTCRSTTQYLAMYESYPRMDEIRCTSCNYKTKIGDMMANHLVDHLDHDAASFRKMDVEDVPVPAEASESIVTMDINPSQGGSFVPIHLLPAGNSSTMLSIKPLLSSKSNMTVTLLGPNKTMPTTNSAGSNGVWTPPKDRSFGHGVELQGSNGLSNRELLTDGGANMSRSGNVGLTKLTVRQLKVLLYALCSGIPQATLRYGTEPELIQDLMLQQEAQRIRKEWIWSTDRIAEWVMCQREQQLPVTEENLLQTATQALEESHEIEEFYEWAVEFMLRHNLSLQASCSAKRPLPRNVYESVRIFTRFVSKQVKDVGFQLPSIGCIDELSIFVDVDQLRSSPEAFQLIGTGEPLVDVVLAGLADGTMLPIMVFIRGKPLRLQKATPDSVLLEMRPEGFTEEERLQLWLAKVWQKHINPQAGGKGLLIMDTHRGHLADDFLAALNSSNTLPAVIPIGCTCRLQPMELCVAPVMREFLQARWCEAHAKNRGAMGPGMADMVLLLLEWLGDVASCLAAQPEILQRSFLMVNTPPQEEGEDGPGEMVRNLTTALVGFSPASSSKKSSKTIVELEDKGVVSDSMSECTLPSLPSNPQALKQVFEKDSDLESFHGFEETDIADQLQSHTSQ